MSNKEIQQFFKEALKSEIAPLLIGLRNDIKENGKKPVSVEFKNADGSTQEMKLPKKGVDYFTEEECAKWLKQTTPKKGVDYFTAKEIEDFKIELLPRKGVEYFTEHEQKAFLSLATPKKGVDYFTDDEIAQFRASVMPIKGIDYNDGYTPVKGVDYNDGKDGTAITAEQIRDALESLRGSMRLSAKAIKDLPQGLTPLGAGGVGGSTSTRFLELLDVPHSYAGQAGKVITVASDESGLIFSTSSGSGDVVGPASATDNAITRYDTTTGKLIQNSNATLDDAGNIVATGYASAVVAKTANYTATDADSIITVDTTGSTAFTITLPTAVGITGREYTIKDVGGNVVAEPITVDGAGSETIDGSLTKVINIPLQSLTLVSNGTNWKIVSSHKFSAGDVVGPASATDESIARFDGTTGKLIQDGANATLNDAGEITITGLTNNSMTAGSILFAGNGGLMSQDNANFFWDITNNRLGIGTASPTSPLSIQSATSDKVSVKSTTGNNELRVYMDDVTANGIQIYTVGASSLGFATNSTGNKLQIDANGIVAVGATVVTNTGLFHVAGASGIVQTIAGTVGSGTATIFNRFSSTGASVYYGIESSAGGALFIGGLAYAGMIGTSNATAFQIATNNNARLTVASSGKVGINQTAPTSMLDVVASSASTIGHIVKGAASQTANLQEWQNSAAVVKASISATGTGLFTRDATNYAAYLQSSSAGDNRAALVWKNSAGTDLWALGPAIQTAGTDQTMYFRDLVSAINRLSIESTGQIKAWVATAATSSTTGALTVMGGISAGQTSWLGAAVTIAGSGDEKLNLRSVNDSDLRAGIVWKNSSGTNLWKMGPDIATAAGEQAFYVYDMITGTYRLKINSSGRVSIGAFDATAVLHLKAGTTAASTAPLKFTSGSLNTTAEAGAVEFLTDKYYGTITTGAARKEFIQGDNAITEAVNIVLGTTTGSKIGTSTTQKLGFWNATPIVQPASANQAALTNNTGGAYNGTLVDVGVVFSQTAINDNFTDVYTLLTEIRTALVNVGIIKGSA